MRRTIQEFDHMRRHAESLPASRLAVVILRDPLMTLKLLRAANGARRGRLSSEITSVEHAIMMMGTVPFFKLFSSLVAVEDLLANDDQALTSVLQVYSRSLHAAFQARQWALQHQDIRVEEVYISALLHDMTNMMLWVYVPRRAQEIRAVVRSEHLYYGLAHEKVMGFSVTDFRASLAASFRFPEMLTELVDCRNAGMPRAQGVLLAVALAHLSERGWYGAPIEACLEGMSETLNLPMDETVELVHQTAVAAARHWALYGVTPAAAWLPMLPGEWVSDEIPSTADERAPSVELDEAVCLMPDRARLQRTLDEIAAHLDGSLDLSGMMSLLMKGMHEGIALNRIVFMLLTRDHLHLKARYVHGAPPDSPFQKLEIGLRETNLFSRLMEKMQGVWLNSGNAKTLLPMVPDAVRMNIGEGEFFAMSLFVHGKPVGLIYADRKHGHCQLDEHAYAEFKKLCVHAAEGLAHLSHKK
ncbi:MAG: HDOD domain-containing protein [Sulfuricellaceae bacterium]|nr:HDOD domain-containing protein [Sulfuricellaceae bacterium]